MRLRTPFLPGISHQLNGRAPRQLRDRLANQIKRFERLSFGGLQELFAPWLPDAIFDKIPMGNAFRRRSFHLELTFFAFLCQVLDPGCACREIVRKIQLWHRQQKLPMPSSGTSGYCQARKRLPLELLQGLWNHTAQALGSEPKETGTWAGHRLLVVDGTGTSMPDTPPNQETYPQPTTQAKGCGFPVMNLVGVFCLRTGAFLNWAEGNLHDHERRLFHRLLQYFRFNDVVLSDRGYSGYAQIASLLQKGAQTVSRVSALRKIDWRKGKRLGPKDRVYQWKRPYQASDILTKKEWRALPKELTVRLIKISIEVPGFRVQSVTMVTTLLDPVRYSAEELADMYRRRWKVEVHYREIKQTLSLDILRCKTPEMIRKELCLQAIAYNLIRAMMKEVADEHGLGIDELSFKGTLDAVRRWREEFQPQRTSRKALKEARAALYQIIAEDLLPYRPNRSEPRAVKRRPKNFRLLTKPRESMVVERCRKYSRKSSKNALN